MCIDHMSCLQDLIARIAEHGSIPVRVDGPYGSASAPEWTHYDHIVMVAGGIGVIPSFKFSCIKSESLLAILPPPSPGRGLLS